MSYIISKVQPCARNLTYTSFPHNQPTHLQDHRPFPDVGSSIQHLQQEVLCRPVWPVSSRWACSTQYNTIQYKYDYYYYYYYYFYSYYYYYYYYYYYCSGNNPSPTTSHHRTKTISSYLLLPHFFFFFFSLQRSIFSLTFLQQQH